MLNRSIMMISFMEQVAHRLLEADLPKSKISVGIRVDIKHLAATPVDASVRVRARLLEISGSRLLFAVTAWDEQEKIGEGKHQRAVVNSSRFQEAIAEKRRNL
jgi:predicted thioesterase